MARIYQHKVTGEYLAARSIQRAARAFYARPKDLRIVSPLHPGTFSQVELALFRAIFS